MMTLLFITLRFAVVWTNAPSRIIDGQPSTIRRFPYLLSLEKYGTHVCGASLIAPRIALTAAHCTHLVSAKAYTVRAGSSTRSYGGQLIQVGRVYAHPKYEPRSHNFDVSVLALKRKLKFDESVKPIALADYADHLYYKGNAEVAGWGVTQVNSSSLPSTLRYITVQAVTHTSCRQAYANVSTITKEMICFRAKDSNQDSCQGDSGGPIVTKGKQIGIVSWGVSCGESKYPGVYSKIIAFRDFIDRHTACIAINACE